MHGLFILLVFWLLVFPTYAVPPPAAAIASAHPLATDAGMEILNAYGLVGGDANAIAPGKRPLSSMTPTFLENERGIAVLGTPGGSRIISMVLLAALEFARGGNAADMVTLPRLHHQFVPDQIFYEADALSAELRGDLEKLGHRLERVTDRYGDMQAVLWDRKAGVSAASDPRRHGKAWLQTQP